MNLQDVIQWCETRGMQDWILLLDHLVVLLRNAILLQDHPTPTTTIQNVIEQTLLMRGWHVASLAQAVGMEMTRLIQIVNQEGGAPSREELAALSSAALKQDGSNWTTEELDVLTRLQYGEAYYAQYTSLPVLVCRNWDLLSNSPIGTERLQALRDCAAPTELEVLRLALWLRLDEDFVRGLSGGTIAW